ncbi:MAG: flagellar hook-basal body complex protein FliE [Limisphaerales bacterium]
MDPLSSIPMGLGASLRAGGMLPPLNDLQNLKNSSPIEIVPNNREMALPGIGKSSSGRSFDNVLGELVKDVNAKQLEAGGKVRAMLAGEDIPLHRVMIAAEEASVSFQLMVEVRNKLLDAYQELMRMQV